LNTSETDKPHATSYDRANCEIGVVHLGFGAFHRAHQAVYIDDYMGLTDDTRWGIAAVNLREAESTQFQNTVDDITRNDGYYLKTYAPDGNIQVRRVRSHVAFADWSLAAADAETFLTLPTSHLVTITVTESGYYTDPDGSLNIQDPIIAAEINGGKHQTVYAYLRAALAKRVAKTGAPLTIACCDNIRKNGKMLRDNLLTYLHACNQTNLAGWVEQHVAFPCSMVDRITPRSPASLATELSQEIGTNVTSPVMAEDFLQWVLQSTAAADMPQLERSGVTVTHDVDPYEETKIRVLNGGHTALVYLAALQGIETYDAAIRDPGLFEHFSNFETSEVLPALTITLPFSKEDYLQQIIDRFGNQAIGDTVARISADGMAKFPIFIRPTVEGCLQQGIVPVYAIRSIASWFVFAQHVNAGNIPFDYREPAWKELKSMLSSETFITSRQLWGDVPATYPAFAETLRHEIAEMESKWPV